MMIGIGLALGWPGEGKGQAGGRQSSAFTTAEFDRWSVSRAPIDLQRCAGARIGGKALVARSSR